MAAFLIDDGYTLSGRIAARHPFPEVRFRYRPAMPAAVEEFLEGRAGGGERSRDAFLKLCEANLVSWDVTDEKGNSVPITRAALARVPHYAWTAFADYLTGYREAEKDDLKN